MRRKGLPMPMHRRSFLLSALTACLGAVGASCASLVRLNRERNRRRIDDAQARFQGPVTACGFLDRPAYAVDDLDRPPPVPYEPQPGDILFSISNSRVFRVGHTLAGAGEISHSALVFRRPDGGLAAAEAGPYDVPLVRSMDLIPHVSA